MSKRVTTAAAAAVILVLVVEWAFGAAAGMSLAAAMLFWAAVCQGMVALAAAADLSGAKWFLPLREHMMGIYPLLFAFPALFLVFAADLSVYPWLDHPTRWLEPSFFVIRNVAMLLLTAVVAHVWVRAAHCGAPSAKVFSTLYILCFVINQSLMAFDWMMSLEPPWINTLFGAYFFIEAFYLGIATTAVVSLFRSQRDPVRYRPVLVDSCKLIFGFALLWAGQIFAQYLTIWYGNIPEEVGYVYKRVAVQPFGGLAVFVLLAMFVLPFAILVARAAKTLPAAVIAAAGLVMAGYFVEKLVFILPAAPVHPAALALEFLLIGTPVALYLFVRPEEPTA
jgi:hypothetical protein